MDTYKKPYFIKRSGVPHAHITDYKNYERKTNRLIFMDGCPLEPQDFDLIFHSQTTFEKQIQYDCIPNNAAVLLVNERTLKLLEEICPDDFQAFPAKIVSEEGAAVPFEEQDYKVINITKMVDALDMDKSNCQFDENGELDWPNKAVLKENCMGSIHLARERQYEPYILASETLKKAFTKAKIRGIKFLKDDQV